jgi:hypothetical protein
VKEQYATENYNVNGMERVRRKAGKGIVESGVEQKRDGRE